MIEIKGWNGEVAARACVVRDDQLTCRDCVHTLQEQGIQFNTRSFFSCIKKPFCNFIDKCLSSLTLLMAGLHRFEHCWMLKCSLVQMPSLEGVCQLRHRQV